METAISIRTSCEIKELVSALAKAQGEMKPAIFNRVNPHYKTRYADFTSCMDACRVPLSQNGLAVIQTPQTIEGKLVLITMLAHVSGQWMTAEFPILSQKMDSQGIGSAMTYAKRYSLCGMVGIVADEEGDDDGNASIGKPTPEPEETLEEKESLLQKYCASVPDLDPGLVKEYLLRYAAYYNKKIKCTIADHKDLDKFRSSLSNWIAAEESRKKTKKGK
jgi:hypothetical protein